MYELYQKRHYSENANLSIKFNEYSFSIDEKKNEIYINTNRYMSSKKDAEELANLIDNAIMLYIAESKK